MHNTVALASCILTGEIVLVHVTTLVNKVTLKEAVVAS